MKKLLLPVIALSLFFAACNSNRKPVQSHEVVWNEKGKDSVVYVQVPREDGSFTNFYMNYLLFNSLFRSGGYTSINNYYTGHRHDFADQSRYSGYSRGYSPSYNSHVNSNSSNYSGSSSNRSYSSPTRSKSYSTPSRSYSSPSRSYSSPSRSYSSPSRSYSSPSRSYSSPTRSFSSPSRH